MLPMQRWLKTYFTDYRYRSVTSIDMRNHFINYFANVEKVSFDIIKSLNWELYLNCTGLPTFPNFNPLEFYDKSLSEKANLLATCWIEKDGEGCTISDLDRYQSKEKMFFLDSLITKATPMKPQVLLRMDTLYKFSFAFNVEVVFRWLMLCVKSHHQIVFPQVSIFLARHGRGLYVKPLYKALVEEDKNFAQKVYQENKNFYHSIICSFVEGLLNKK